MGQSCSKGLCCQNEQKVCITFVVSERGHIGGFPMHGGLLVSSAELINGPLIENQFLSQVDFSI